MTDVIKTPPVAARRRPRWLAGVALGAAFVLGGVASAGLAVAAEGMAMHHMVMGGPGGMHGQMMAHLTKMLDAVGASPEQKSKIEGILHAGLAPMAGMHAEMEHTHATLHAIFAAPTIDRAALEQLRAAEVAKLDQNSRTMVAAMADAAEVLTPDQRRKLAAMIAERHKPS
jgi:Spy/CpxP family protein refolding chaperone